MTVKRFPFVGQINTRGRSQGTNFTTYDLLYQNVVFVAVRNELTREVTVYVEKRAGFADPGSSGNTGISAPHRIFMWLSANSGADLLVASGINSAVTRVSVAGTVPATIKDHANGNHTAYFSQTADSSGTPMLIWQRAVSTDGDEVWGFPHGGAAAQITVPAGVVGQVVHMDGWTFAGVGSNGRIYNSSLNDPTAGYTDYITDNSNADNLVSLFKFMKYVLALGTNGITWYRNAGNASGSPLQEVRHVSGTGLLSGHGICQGPSGEVYFASRGERVGVGIHVITESGMKEISTPSVRAILTTRREETPTRDVDMRYVNFHGHNTIIVGLTVSGGDTDTPVDALVYFPDTGLWAYWTAQSAGNGLRCNTLTYNTALGALVAIYKLTSNPERFRYSRTLSDYGDPVTITITRSLRTAVQDHGTGKRKFEHSLRIIGDRQPSSYPITVAMTDDDYATTSVSKTINMQDENPLTTRNGAFRRRAYTFSDTTANPGRLQGYETDVTEGAN